MKKPTKCVTPKNDRETYELTATDIRKLTALVKEANDILSYYVNMPENKTGELEATHNLSFDNLCVAAEDLFDTLINITLV